MSTIDRFVDADAEQLLGIYLNDHRAAAAAGRALAARCGEANRGHPLGDYLRETFVPQLDEDRQVLDEICDDHGVVANPVKVITARVAEVAGRMKTNGRLTGYSPLSRVIELEALLAGVRAKIALWTVLLGVPRPTTGVNHDVGDLLTRASRQRERLEHHHHEAVLAAFPS